MTLAYRSYTAYKATISGNYVITKPSGTVEGDTLVFIASWGWNGLSGNDLTPPAGWTQKKYRTVDNENGSYGVWTRTAGASEGSSYSWVPDGLMQMTSIMICLSGGHGTPVDVESYTDSSGITTGDVTISSVTTNYANSIVIAGLCTRAYDTGTTTWTPPTGFTELVDNYEVSTLGITVAYKQFTAAGATGSLVFDNVDNSDHQSVNKVVIAIRENTAQSLTGTITATGTLAKVVKKNVSGSTGNLTGSLLTGAAYFKSLTGTMGSLSGTLVKTANKALSGTFTGTGALNRNVTKAFTGIMGNLTGAVNATKTKLVSVSGTMGALSGAVTTRQTGFGVALSGSISSISGSIVRRTNKSVTGVISPTGRVTLLGTFRSAIMKAGTIIRRTIQGGSG